MQDLSYLNTEYAREKMVEEYQQESRVNDQDKAISEVIAEVTTAFTVADCDRFFRLMATMTAAQKVIDVILNDFEARRKIQTSR